MAEGVASSRSPEGTKPGAVGRRSPSDVSTWALTLLEPSAYEAYRRRQAHALLALIPRAEIRTVYAQARSWAKGLGRHDGKDPMTTLVRFCEELLPLPPFEVWREDAIRHLEAHLAELEAAPRSGEKAGTDRAVPLETRRIVADGARWRASVSVFRTPGAWKGFLTFQRGPGAPAYRTAAIFREEAPEAVRRRFRSFDDEALRAFLRSVLP